MSKRSYRKRLKRKWVKGRKLYHCEHCGSRIEKGEIHFYEHGHHKGVPIYKRLCLECGKSYVKEFWEPTRSNLLEKLESKLEKQG